MANIKQHIYLLVFLAYGNKYLLVVIDIFSPYGWIEPLKDKTAHEVNNAFDKILLDGRIPKCLQTDSGKEFTNNSFQEYLNTKNIVHFTNT